ncbi:DUF2179 domain-containing protein [soil metagenome]
MDWLSQVSTWEMAWLIFLLRVCDVSMGTLRTIAVVQGKLTFSVFLGFFEVLLWVLGVSQVITGLQESPILAVAYATGFAAGNGVGILIERRLAMGSVVIRIISTGSGPQIANALRQLGQRLTTFQGQGRDGPVTLVYITCTRRQLPRLLAAARVTDPRLFYTVEPLRESSSGLTAPLAFASGWRGLLKRK